MYRCPNAEQFELRDQYERWLRKPEGLPFHQRQLRDIGRVASGSMNSWGKNRIHAVSNGLLAVSDADIEFGVDDYWAHHYAIGKWEK